MKGGTNDPIITVSHSFSSKKRSGSYRYYGGAGYPLRGIGIPLSLRLLHFSMKQASLRIGFDEEQVRFIWRTASLYYSLNEVSTLFSKTMESFESAASLSMFVFNHMNPQPIYREPDDSLVGQGAMAIRVLARLKSVCDQKIATQERYYIIDDGALEYKFKSRRVASWEVFTSVLAEKLVKDGLATDRIRDKVFSQDLGL